MMNWRLFSGGLGLTIAAYGATSPAPALAQALEEIVVTARKVEENLLEVPLAITAFSSRDIESMNLKQLNDIALMTPSFNFVNQQGASGRNDRSSRSLTFRGLFLNNNTGSAAGGQLFIDGAPVISAAPPSMSDVERVEILKGPQSTHFGRSTFMGAINFVTREPSEEFSGRLSGEFSSFNSSEGTLSLEGPIVEDKVFARISGRSYKRGGHYRNAANGTQRLGEESSKSVAGTLVFKPADDLKVKLFINSFSDSDGPPAQSQFKLNPWRNCFPGIGAAPNTRQFFGYICGAVPTMADVPVSDIGGDFNLTPFLFDQVWNQTPAHWKIFDPYFIDHYGVERRAIQADLRIDYEFGDGYSFSALSAFHRDKNSTVIDSTYFADEHLPNLLYNPNIAPNNTYPQNFVFMRLLQGLSKDYSQELRLSSPQDQSLRFTFGGNVLYFRSPGNTVFGYDVRTRAFAASITRNRLNTPAVFGGGYYDIMENLTLSVEARYQWDKIKQTPYVNLAGQIVTGAAANPLKATFKSFSPRVSLDWQVTEETMVYTLFSRGYRPGGFNAALATATAQTLAALVAAVPNAGVSFLQEKLDNYEAGIKGSFFDDRARATLSVYYDKYKNGQSGAAVPIRLEGPPVVTNLVNLTVNTGLATLKGFELEAQVQATEGLVISGTMGLNDTKISTARFDIYSCTDCLNIQNNNKLGLGNRLPTTPKWMWTLSAQYDAPLFGDYSWFSRVDYAHRGRNFTDFTNLAWVGASNNVNARVGIRTEALSIEGFVTNLTQNKVVASALGSFDVYTNAFPPIQNSIRYSLPLKRTWGVRASYNF